ncbi:MAG: hypothetical protein HYY40_11210 [Bacteroidetes bacterium]|nr:hypothetical protein [Bacteroidota bacterium]
MKKQNSALVVLTICTGLLILYFIFSNKIFLYISGIVGVLSVFSGWIREKISFVWMKLAEVLGAIMSRVILTLVFYLILFPVALISRIQRKDVLQINPPKDDTSFFHKRDHVFNAEDIEKMW